MAPKYVNMDATTLKPKSKYFEEYYWRLLLFDYADIVA